MSFVKSMILQKKSGQSEKSFEMPHFRSLLFAHHHQRARTRVVGVFNYFVLIVLIVLGPLKPLV